MNISEIILENDDELNCITNQFGDNLWRNNAGELHREDGPAVEFPNGAKFWYQNDKRHREDGPAVERIDGTKEYWKHGKRMYAPGELDESSDGSDGPRCETDRHGTTRWYNDANQLHREDGPACVWADGYKSWYQHGNLHREDGPAIVRGDGTSVWYLHGRQHREDGPAIELANGHKEYWKHGKRAYGPGEIDESTTTEPESVLVVDKLGTKTWKNEKGQYHRIDGPAIITPSGATAWYYNGKLHREDGPASEWGPNNKYKSWHKHGKRTYAPGDLEELTESASDNHAITRAANQMSRNLQDILKHSDGKHEKTFEKLLYSFADFNDLSIDDTNNDLLNQVLYKLRFKVYPGKTSEYNPNHKVITIGLSDIDKDGSMTSAIAHELAHALDDAKSNKKAFKTQTDLRSSGVKFSDLSREQYLRFPHEVNARFQQAMSDITRVFPKLKAENIELDTTAMNKIILWAFKNNELDFIYPKDSPKYKRLLSRAYRYFDHEDFQNEIITEDNNDSIMTVRPTGSKVWRNSKGEIHREDGPAYEFANGSKSWYQNGKLHREDGPAIDYVDGTKQYWKHGKKVYAPGELDESTDDATSISRTYSDGTKSWTNGYGQYHREDGPAIVWDDGTTEWWVNGKRHRENGPAIEYATGDKEYYKHGKQVYAPGELDESTNDQETSTCHTDSNGDKRWWNEAGELHRENDLPAVEYADGSKFWFLHNKKHRENGPAVAWASGNKEYYKYGKQTYRPGELEDLNEYKVDNDISSGLGATGHNANIDYRGFKALMRPSTFLKLALPLGQPTSVDYIVQHMKDGKGLGSPFLIVDLPEEWFDGDLSKPARVRGHEGRNRMLAIQQLEGDNPVEVHIIPNGEIRARHLTPEMLKAMQQDLVDQAKTSTVSGANFSVLSHNPQGR